MNAPISQIVGENAAGRCGDPELDALWAIETAVRLIQPTHVFGMMSGGRDSLCASHLVSRHPAFSGIIHLNTGIGIEATRQYVRDFCWEQGWPLIEQVAPPCRWAPDIPAYDALVLKFGFPGPGQHMMMYNRLKERALSKVSAACKRPIRRKILLISGTRNHESLRRMRQAKQFAYEKSWAWAAAIFNWHEEDKWTYIHKWQLRTNPVNADLCMSGECLCGAFAKEGEMATIEALYPDDAARIRRLEATVREAGVKLCRWGQTKKDWMKLKKAEGGMLCTSCMAAAEEEASRIEDVL